MRRTSYRGKKNGTETVVMPVHPSYRPTQLRTVVALQSAGDFQPQKTVRGKTSAESNCSQAEPIGRGFGGTSVRGAVVVVVLEECARPAQCVEV